MSDKSVFYKRMPGGIAGQVTREEMAKKEPQMMSPTAPPLFYGIPVKMDGNGKVTFITGAGDKIRGFLTRPYPVQEESINYEGFSMGQPSVKQPCDILRSGYMMVQCLAGIAVVSLWAGILGWNALYAPIPVILLTVSLTFATAHWIFAGKKGSSAK